MNEIVEDSISNNENKHNQSVVCLGRYFMRVVHEKSKILESGNDIILNLNGCSKPTRCPGCDDVSCGTYKEITVKKGEPTIFRSHQYHHSHNVIALVVLSVERHREYCHLKVMLRILQPLTSHRRFRTCCTVLAISVFGSQPLLSSSLLGSIHPSTTSCSAATDRSTTTTSTSSNTRQYSVPAFRSASMPASTDSTIEVAQFPCLSDNYGYLIHDPETGVTAAIDTPEAEPIEEELERRGWKLTHILNTHHHYDHTGGNLELSKGREIAICGPASEKIPGRTIDLNGGDEINFGSQKVIIIDVGGHTLGHIAYYFPYSKKVFVGDALFTLGCGRMFEGTPDQFWASLSRLRDLPDDTQVYCAHEYTEANAKFALSVEPGNSALQSKVAQIKDLRAKNLPTVPTSIKEEKETNPFLRCDASEEVRKNTGVQPGDSEAQAFAKVRKAKDSFRG